ERHQDALDHRVARNSPVGTYRARFYRIGLRDSFAAIAPRDASTRGGTIGIGLKIRERRIDRLSCRTKRRFPLTRVSESCCPPWDAAWRGISPMAGR